VLGECWGCEVGEGCVSVGGVWRCEMGKGCMCVCVCVCGECGNEVREGCVVFRAV